MSGSQYSINTLTPNDGITLGAYVPLGITPDISDYEIIVDKKYENKPGWLAYDLYGTERLAWVFMVYNPNKISDPIYDLKSGMKIIVPTRDRIMSYL